MTAPGRAGHGGGVPGVPSPPSACYLGRPRCAEIIAQSRDRRWEPCPGPAPSPGGRRRPRAPQSQRLGASCWRPAGRGPERGGQVPGAPCPEAPPPGTPTPAHALPGGESGRTEGAVPLPRGAPRAAHPRGCLLLPGPAWRVARGQEGHRHLSHASPGAPGPGLGPVRAEGWGWGAGASWDPTWRALQPPPSRAHPGPRPGFLPTLATRLMLWQKPESQAQAPTCPPPPRFTRLCSRGGSSQGQDPHGSVPWARGPRLHRAAPRQACERGLGLSRPRRGGQPGRASPRPHTPVFLGEGFGRCLREGTLGGGGRRWVLPRHIRSAESISGPVGSELGGSSRLGWGLPDSSWSPRTHAARGPASRPPLLLRGEGQAEGGGQVIDAPGFLFLAPAITGGDSDGGLPSSLADAEGVRAAGGDVGPPPHGGAAEGGPQGRPQRGSRRAPQPEAPDTSALRAPVPLCRAAPSRAPRGGHAAWAPLTGPGGGGPDGGLRTRGVFPTWEAGLSLELQLKLSVLPPSPPDMPPSPEAEPLLAGTGPQPPALPRPLTTTLSLSLTFPESVLSALCSLLSPSVSWSH